MFGCSNSRRNLATAASDAPPMETDSFLRPAITPRPLEDQKKKKRSFNKDCNCCRASSAVLGALLLMAGLASFLVGSSYEKACLRLRDSLSVCGANSCNL